MMRLRPRAALLQLLVVVILLMVVRGLLVGRALKRRGLEQRGVLL
jgi:hypothetical protein